MAKNKVTKCDACATTGVLRANLVKTEVNGVLKQDHIDIVYCAGDHDISVGEKTVQAMGEASGLPVNVVGAEKPVHSNH